MVTKAIIPAINITDSIKPVCFLQEDLRIKSMIQMTINILPRRINKAKYRKNKVGREARIKAAKKTEINLSGCNSLYIIMAN